MNPVPKPVKKHSARKRIKVQNKEHEIQAMAEELCIRLGIRYFRIPDYLLGYLARFAPPPIRRYVTDYLAGAPDMFLFKPIPGGNRVMFLEIKTEAGELSLNQEKWHSGLNVKVVRGWEETKEAISDFYMDSLT